MLRRNFYKYAAQKPSSLLTKSFNVMPLIVALTFILACISTTYPSSILVAASQSGIYGDNGHDQTILHHALNEEEKIAASYDILEFLGLPERPRRKHSHLSLR